MALTTLTAGNDTVYLYEGFLGGINSQSASLDLLNVTLDGSGGTDTLVVDDSYPSTNFTITTSANGVTTLSTASGFLSVQNFEKIQFRNTSLNLAPSVSTVPTAGNDSITGTAGNDNIAALAGNDTIQGMAGNDTLDGGAGTDSLVGGLGNDTYVIDSTADVVSEASGTGTGTDLVRVAVATAGGTYAVAANVENATLINTVAYNLTGNTLANTLTGNAAANILNGGAGADRLSGGLGNDTYLIDTTADIVSEAAGAGTDLVKVAVATAGGTYTLAANVERAILTNTVAFNLTGNALANTLTGNTAANVLNGGGGADKLSGGLGNDTYLIDTLADVVSEAAGAGTDLVKVAVATTGGSYTLAANVENATLTNSVAFNLSGNALANTLTGNAAANILNGGAGKDILSGGAGSDTFLFNSALSATLNVDTIKDYDLGGIADRIFLDDAVFSALGIVGSAAGVALNATLADATKFCLGTQALGLEDRIIYDQLSGKLYYDPTGSANGAADQVQFALIGTTSHPLIDAGDFFVA